MQKSCVLFLKILCAKILLIFGYIFIIDYEDN